MQNEERTRKLFIKKYHRNCCFLKRRMLKKFNVKDSGISPNEQEQHGHYCYILPRQGGEIETPGPMDVICGRGKRINKHGGNVRFREIIHKYKEKYSDIKLKKSKWDFAFSVLQEIRATSTSSKEGSYYTRFLDRGSDKEKWFEIGDQRAVRKVGQALREYENYDRTKKKKETVTTIDTTAPVSLPQQPHYLYENDHAVHSYQTLPGYRYPHYEYTPQQQQCQTFPLQMNPHLQHTTYPHYQQQSSAMMMMTCNTTTVAQSSTIGVATSATTCNTEERGNTKRVLSPSSSFSTTKTSKKVFGSNFTSSSTLHNNDESNFEKGKKPLSFSQLREMNSDTDFITFFNKNNQSRMEEQPNTTRTTDSTEIESLNDDQTSIATWD